jgi:hypothetical protein
MPTDPERDRVYPEGLIAGTEVGAWHVVERLSIGGQGAVYRVEDHSLQRRLPFPDTALAGPCPWSVSPGGRMGGSPTGSSAQPPTPAPPLGRASRALLPG